MKKMYLFKLIGEDIIDGDNNDFSHPFYSDLSEVISNDDVKYMGFGKNETMFMSMEDYRFNIISAVFKKYFVLSIADVTDDVMNGKILIEYPEVNKELFEEFRLDNTTLDDVLDKINKFGIESLDYIDKMILGS
jgi:hypothetical protein